MTEPKIRDYLLGLIDAKDLVKADRPVSNKVEPYWKVVDMIQEGEFFIEPKHLIAVCDDVLDNKMSPETLDNLAFILIASDYFTWDTEDKKGEKVGEVLNEWCNPTINFPLTVHNVRQWKNYLTTGYREMGR